MKITGFSEPPPRHIAIIMDGNALWAHNRHLNTINGHRQGIEVMCDIIACCREIGVEYLTLSAFSWENWQHPAEEISYLVSFLDNNIKKDEDLFFRNRIRFKVIGNINNLPSGLADAIKGLEDKTAFCSGMHLQLAFNYSSREEIVHAARAIVMKVSEGSLKASEINERIFSEELSTYGIPDPDLLIRTSGESKISNFLLWQLAYTEIYITDVLWPDFTREHLTEAIIDYQGRERRYGLVKKDKVGTFIKNCGVRILFKYSALL